MIENWNVKGHPFHEMTQFPQWVVWKLLQYPGDKKPRKVPYNPVTHTMASTVDPTTWSSYEQAVAVAASYSGVGFVFNEMDPFFFADVDGAILENGEWNERALQVKHLFTGCAFEKSQSLTGYHIFGKADIVEKGRNQSGLELYTRDRFCAMTGIEAEGDSNMDANASYHDFTDNYFTKESGGGAINYQDGLKDGPLNGKGFNGSDADLLKKMKKGLKKSEIMTMIGKTPNCPIDAMYNLDVKVLAAHYPNSDGGKDKQTGELQPYDYTRADGGLLMTLAWWTDSDEERMRRLYCLSELDRPDVSEKGYRKLKYGIKSAVSKNAGASFGTFESNVLEAPAPIAGEAPLAPPPPVSVAGQVRAIAKSAKVMPHTGQIDWFKDCVYVKKQKAVYIPEIIEDDDKKTQQSGCLQNKEEFNNNSNYNGWSFQMETADGWTNDPWDAFVKSRVINRHQVEDVIFDPTVGSGSIVKRDGLLYVNTYAPDRGVCSIPGNIDIFLDHIKRLLPHGDDGEILISYMAACIQYPGVKFMWAPFIQGTPGNGKSILGTIVSRAIGRKFVAKPKKNDIKSDFNGWLDQKLLILIEDFGQKNSHDFCEPLKSMITDGEDFMIQKKKQDQRPVDIFCNFMFMSNFQDAMYVDEDDRRICILFTDQQCKEDIIKDGVKAHDLHIWLTKENGYAKMTDFLETYDIPDKFNPATDCFSRPMTTSWAKCFLASAGEMGEEIKDLVDEGRFGFHEEIVSYTSAKSFLGDKTRFNKGISLSNDIKRSLRSLGYIKFRKLNNKIEGKNHTLWVKPDSHIHYIKSDAEVKNYFLKLNAALDLDTLLPPAPLKT